MARDTEFKKDKELIAYASGYCQMLQKQVLDAKDMKEMFKIMKQHSENCPNCQGNLAVLG